MESLECDSNTIVLDANDVYKDLRSRGFDYGSKFRGIKKLINKDCVEVSGAVEWTGNWITFLDSLLQTQLLGLPFRQLMVPVMIASIRCDPKVLFDAIKDYQELEIENKINKNKTNIQGFDNKVMTKPNEDMNVIKEIKKDISIGERVKMLDELTDNDNNSNGKDGKAVLTFFSDLNINIIISHGIEIEGLLAIPIPRKELAQNLKLESYQFIANMEMEATDQLFKDKIIEYIEV